MRGSGWTRRRKKKRWHQCKQTDDHWTTWFFFFQHHDHGVNDDCSFVPQHFVVRCVESKILFGSARFSSCKIVLAFGVEYLCAICGKHIFKYNKSTYEKQKNRSYLQAKIHRLAPCTFLFCLNWLSSTDFQTKPFNWRQWKSNTHTNGQVIKTELQTAHRNITKNQLLNCAAIGFNELWLCKHYTYTDIIHILERRICEK